MPIKITVSKELARLVDIARKDGLVNKVREEFSKRGPLKTKQAIIQDMLDGVSPVKNKTWRKYSDSYKAQIEGKQIFWKKGGKVFTAKAKKGKRFKTEGYKRGKAKGEVNLKLTGGLHKKLKVFTTPIVSDAWRMIIEFRSFLAVVHNNLGVKSKTYGKLKRRLLPTRPREQFNNRIQKTILSEMQKAVNTVVKQFSRR